MKTTEGITRSNLLYAIVAMAALVALAELVLYSGWNVHLFHTVRGSREYPQLDVDDALRNSERLMDTIAVEGRVSIVDLSTRSFLMCGLRKGVRLKVEYGGKLPALNDSVLVIGQLHRGKDPVLVARGVELQ
jgi:hypothetical protein